jgi:phosphoenolpyruvate synthase/pyruvate phosphate dikinase
MTDLQIVDSLIDLIAKQSELIRQLVYELKQQEALSDEIADGLYEADMRYENIFGEAKP